MKINLEQVLHSLRERAADRLFKCWKKKNRKMKSHSYDTPNCMHRPKILYKIFNFLGIEQDFLPSKDFQFVAYLIT